MSQKHSPQSITIFYAPLWVDRYSDLISGLISDSRFTPLKKDFAPQYLLPYATSIYMDDALYFAFELNREYLPSMCMYAERLNLKHPPVLEKIRISAFSTGCAFAEFHISYNGLSIEEIVDFSFHFKKATKTDTRNNYSLTMHDILTDLLSSVPSAELFFTGSDFKRECRMFHQIFCEHSINDQDIQKHLRHLSRGYHNNFLPPQNDSDYDMIYQPYFYDYWAGSQEGLVNLFYHSDDKATDHFIDNYKQEQLIRNYSFMYVLLLNQRFSSIKLISRISLYSSYTRKEKEELNRQIVQLKTSFAFNIISDDQLYQNVYRRLYILLDIDRLLDDIRDNEQQVEIIQNHEALETEKLTSRFLFGLSILSIFSVLIDASSYFDRIPYINEISTVLSFICMIVIVMSYFVWWFRYRNK